MMFKDYQTQGPLSKRFIKLDINCVILHCFYSSEFRTRMESVVKDLEVRIEMPRHCDSAKDMATNMLVLHLHGPQRTQAAYRLRRFLKAYWCKCQSQTKKEAWSFNLLKRNW